MTNSTMINYSTRDFATKEQLELYLPAVEGLTTKVVGSHGVIVHEFVADDFQD